MKRKELLAEIRGKSADALRSEAREIAEELMKLRCRQITGQLEQSHRFVELRRKLARVNTVLAQTQRGANA